SEIEESNIKTFIQALIQALILRGYYRKDKFVVSAIFKHPIIQASSLTPKRKQILGLLTQNQKIKLKTITTILQHSKNDIINELEYLVSRGLIIGSLKEKTLYLDWVWKPTDKVKISEEDTFIVGTCMMLRKAELSKVSSLVSLPKEKLLTRLTYLMLYEKLEAKFKVEQRFFWFSKVFVIVDKYVIAPKKVPLSLLQGSEKDVSGYILLKKRVSIKELTTVIEKPAKDIIKILANLTARGTFQFIFDKKNKITPVLIPELKPTRTIEEMATLSFFNYEALFGILSTQDRIALKKLAELMNRTIGEVLEGVITLLFEGFITCTLKGKFLYIESIKRYSRAQEGTLERWEKIVLGMVIAKAIISVKDISAALGIDKIYAKEKLYAFYGKGLIKGSIVGNRLIPEEIPIFPPLVQLEDLPIHFQEIFGYLIANQRVSIKNVQKYWNKSSIAAKNILYELTGSGLIHIELIGKNVNVVSHQKFLPTRDLEDLGKNYLRVANAIEKKRRKRRVKIKNIALDLDLPEIDVFKIICQLIAHGYYKGNISSTIFERKGRLILPARKTYCLNCGHVIKSPNDPCSNCGQLPQKCSVCQGLIKRGESIFECPNCGNYAHEEHMLQWLKIKEECPICKTKINKSTLKHISI
ncbi:MAG: hypothetical protein ACTSSF_05835, partial [Candidatus Heimdallarchaeaceae archaeon]